MFFIVSLCGLLFILLALKLWICCLKDVKNVCIIVLGDLGRSPRMQYHVLSFVRAGFNVDFIGYPGSSALEQIEYNSHVNIYYLPRPPALENRLPTILNYIVKVLWQTFTLLFVLFTKRISNYILIQNPPAIPTIPICWFFSVLSESKFFIDWHNYGHSLMALSLKKDHTIVKIAKFIETYFGRKAWYNFCVSQAMKEDLLKQWGIQAHVLYDRSEDRFKSMSLEDKHWLLHKLSENHSVFKGETSDSTIFTNKSGKDINLLDKRPGFIISSTSWTEDEDFSILINALQEYENACKEENSGLVDLLCVITGKGPLKEFYTSIITSKNWKHVKIAMLWLKNNEYHQLLACADLGICLHTSSSGLDLPMKVVDMFGCGLPVCAYNYLCLSELVKHDKNSYVFSNEYELAQQLKSWFYLFPNNNSMAKTREKFQKELLKFQEVRWHENWHNNVLHCFK